MYKILRISNNHVIDVVEGYADARDYADAMTARTHSKHVVVRVVDGEILYI